MQVRVGKNRNPELIIIIIIIMISSGLRFFYIWLYCLLLSLLQHARQHGRRWTTATVRKL